MKKKSRTASGWFLFVIIILGFFLVAAVTENIDLQKENIKQGIEIVALRGKYSHALDGIEKLQCRIQELTDGQQHLCGDDEGEER